MTAVLSLAFPLLLGLGYLPWRLLGGTASVDTRRQAAVTLSIIFAGALLADETVTLAIQNLRIGGFVLATLSLTGWLLMLHDQWTGWMRVGPGISLFTIAFIVVLASRTFSEPAGLWDARSIWFFHARMIYFGGTAGNAAGWNELFSSFFSHPDYPILFPLLAAQIAKVAGFWNEYLPKFAMTLLFVPPLLGYLSFFSIRQPSSILLVAASLLLPGQYLWNCYSDGPLALYCGLATVTLGRWLIDKDESDLLLSIVSIGVACSLKNEAELFMILLWVALAVAAPRRMKTRISPWLALAFAGPALWAWDKLAWNLQNDLKLGLGSFVRLAHRSPSDYATIFNAFREVAPLPVLLTAVVVLAMVTLKRHSVAARFTMLCAALNVFGVFAVYLMTPHDILWHLQTSVDRTLMPAMMAAIAAIYFIQRELEEPVPPAGSVERTQGWR